jgi:hypothetical protein
MCRRVRSRASGSGWGCRYGSGAGRAPARWRVAAGGRYAGGCPAGGWRPLRRRAAVPNAVSCTAIATPPAPTRERRQPTRSHFCPRLAANPAPTPKSGRTPAHPGTFPSTPRGQPSPHLKPGTNTDPPQAGKQHLPTRAVFRPHLTAHPAPTPNPGPTPAQPGRFPSTPRRQPRAHDRPVGAPPAPDSPTARKAATSRGGNANEGGRRAARPTGDVRRGPPEPCGASHRKRAERPIATGTEGRR